MDLKKMSSLMSKGSHGKKPERRDRMGGMH
jgi:hypothetical protein